MEKSLQVYEPSFLASVGITLTRTSLEIPDGLSFGNWCKIGEQLSIVEAATHWAIGDWLVYAGKQYGETYTEAKVLTGFAIGTLQKDKYVASHVQSCTRVQDLTWKHHQLVAPLEQDQQVYWLNLAHQNGWSVAELRRQMKMQLASEVPPPPPGKYRVIYADPPWQYSNSGFDQSAESQYPTMPIEAVCELPIAQLADSECVLFLWATSPLLPEAIQVMAAWGFEYKASRVWVKDKAPGIGWFIRTRHELLLIGVRGRGHPLEKLDSVFESAVGKHSAKPATVYDDIEQCYGGPYIELFARNIRKDWMSWGSEV